MKNAGYIAAIGILAVVVAVLGYKVSQKGKVVDAQSNQISEIDLERQNLMQELEIMELRYDTMRTDNSVLRAELEDQRMSIDDLQTKLNDRNYSLGKARKEAETLRNIMKGYIVTIDSLNQLNIALMAERDQMAMERDQVMANNDQLRDDLSTSEEIISAGKVLQTGNFDTQGIFLRNSGTQKETTRASKVELIKSCFTVRRNPIAEAGAKSIYMQIEGPDKKVLPSKNGVMSATLDGFEQQYSVQREIDYRNDEMDVCVFYSLAEGQELPKGDYTIRVFEGGVSIGRSSMSLR